MFTQLINEFVTRIVEEFMQWLNSKIARVTNTPPPPLSSAERSATAQGQAPATPSLAPAQQRARDDGHER